MAQLPPQQLKPVVRHGAGGISTMTAPIPSGFFSQRTLNKDETRALKEQMFNKLQLESAAK